MKCLLNYVCLLTDRITKLSGVILQKNKRPAPRPQHVKEPIFTFICMKLYISLPSLLQSTRCAVYTNYKVKGNVHFKVKETWHALLPLCTEKQNPERGTPLILQTKVTIHFCRFLGLKPGYHSFSCFDFDDSYFYLSPEKPPTLQQCPHKSLEYPFNL